MSLHCKEPGTDKTQTGPEPLICPSSSSQKLGEANPCTQPAFPLLGFEKIKNRKRPANWQIAKRNSLAGLRPWDLSSLGPQTKIDGGKPQGKKASCRGLGLLSAGCREVPRGRGPGREDFPATQGSSKSSLCMTPVAHRREFLR